jgi:hypothetical protein
LIGDGGVTPGSLQVKPNLDKSTMNSAWYVNCVRSVAMLNGVQIIGSAQME